MRWQLTFESADRHQDPLIGERNKKKRNFRHQHQLKSVLTPGFLGFGMLIDPATLIGRPLDSVKRVMRAEN